MKLLTKAIEAKLLKGKIISEECAKVPIIVKFFNPTGQGTWYVTEGTKLEDGDWEFFGLADIFEPELGYFRLSELETVRLPFGLHIERDLWFDGKFLDTTVTPARIVEGQDEN